MALFTQHPTTLAIADLDLTPEQTAVVNAVTHKNRNAVVNAVAGSGKTRTALATAIQWLQSRTDCTSSPPFVLLIAYNKRLQEDMVEQRDRFAPSTIRPFIDIRTIHGFGHRYFGGEGLTTDRQLTNWTKSRALPMRQLHPFGLVIIDEAQDLTPVLFDFLHYVLTLLSRPQLLILGDPFQLLYRFKGADESYIVDADIKLADVAAQAPFEHFRLSICFRISHEMATWINTHLNPNNLSRAKAPFKDWFDQHKEQIAEWWGEGIKANPRRPPEPNSVIYCVKKDISYKKKRHESTVDAVVKEIVKVFEQYDTNSSALLSPSITANFFSPVRLVTNNLRKVNAIPQSWFFDSSSGYDGPPPVAVLLNKRIASTIHKFKGRERDAIVMLALDDFSELIEKNDPRNVFNMFYVGATRAKKQLLIVQWSDRAYATHMSRTEKTVDDEPPSSPYSVKKTLKHCPYNETLCEESPSCLQSNTICSIPPISLGHEDYIVSGAHNPHRLSTMEDVSEIIGLAVKVKLQLLLDDGVLEVPDVSADEQMPRDLIYFMEKLRTEAPSRNDYSWAEVLEIATALLTVGEQLYYRWRQVRNFERWPVVRRPAKLDEVVRNLVRLLDVVSSEKSDNTQKVISGKAVGGLAYAEMVERLKARRCEGGIFFHPQLIFSMEKNPAFVRQCSSVLIGVADIMVLTKQRVKRLREQLKQKIGKTRGDIEDVRDKEKYEEEDDNGSGLTLVEVNVAMEMRHDDLLEVGIYGAMHREMSIGKRATRIQLAKDSFKKSEKNVTGLSQAQTSSVVEVQKTDEASDCKNGIGEKVGMSVVEMKMPEMYVAYPNIGELRKVDLGMNSFEFLHRVGFRKVNRPFDLGVLKESDVSGSSEAAKKV